MGRIKINTISLGLLLMSVYVFMCYNALNIVIPQRITSLVLYLFLAYGVFAFIINAKINPPKMTAYTAWYLVFMCVSLVTMLYAPDFDILSGEFYLMIVSFALTFLFQFFVHSERSFELMCWLYSISAAILVLTLMLTGNMVADANNRLGGDIMGNANTFASMIMVAVMYGIWLLLYQKTKPIFKLLLLGMIILDYYALILSAGRKFFVLPFVFLYILLLFKVDKKGRKHIIRYTLLIVALVAFVAWLIMAVPTFYRTIGYRIESYIYGVTGVEEQGASAAIREEMQRIALVKWTEKPILGYGFDSFKYYNLSATGHFFYSHCNFTEMLYNGGIVYFLIYYIVYWFILRRALVLKRGMYKHRAFAVGVALSFLIFDYGCVSYSMSVIQIMLAMALHLLGINETQDNLAEGIKEI